jgi:hypothetical protein
MTLLLMALLVVVSATSSAATFNNSIGEDKLSGKYEGVAKNDQMGDIPLTVEIKNDNGKLSGKMDIPTGSAAITSGTYADGKITMKFDAGGQEGTINGTVEGDKITGKWELAGQTGTFELKKTGAMASAPKTNAAASGDPVSGDWDAEADAQGNTIPFTLKLKLEGDKVTGSSESAMGNAPLTKGSFAGDKLTFSLDIPQGAITFTGMVKDGKINGEFEIPGMGAGKWQAKKK